MSPINNNISGVTDVGFHKDKGRVKSYGISTKWGIVDWIPQSCVLAFMPQIVPDNNDNREAENPHDIAENMTWGWNPMDSALSLV